MSLIYHVVSKGTAPYWPQGNTEYCQHSAGEYCGSFELSGEVNGKFDVYLTSRYPAIEGMSTCIRFGDDGPEYYTPGHPRQMVQFAERMPAYAEALKLILDRCCDTYLKPLDAS